MQFHYAQAPNMYGYWGQPPEFAEWAEAEPFAYGDGYAEDPYGYAEPPEMAGWGEADFYGQYEPVGYYGDYGQADFYGYEEPPEFGWGQADPYGEYEPPVGYFAEEYPVAGYQDYADYAEDYPMGWYGQADPYAAYGQAPEMFGYGQYDPASMGWYGQAPEMFGYGQYDPASMGWYGQADPYGEADPYAAYGQVPEMVGYGQYWPLSGPYGEPEFQGYVREVPPRFNAGCRMPTNVAGYEGYDEAMPLEGYVKPGEVSPRCEQFTPQPEGTPAVPETFRPLW